MVLNHIAAVLFFAGQLFYCGLWMAVDPAAFANPLRRVAPRFDNRPAIRFTGILLLLLAIVI